MELVEIATVLKPQGIYGEIKAKHYAGNPDEFLDFSTLYVKTNGEVKPYVVEDVRVHGVHVVVKLQGINTRNDAEMMRAQMLYVQKSALNALPKGEFLIRDLVGMQVVTKSGKTLGKLTNVLQHGAVDVYCIDKTKLMFPALKRVIISTDMAAKTMTVDDEALKEVAVYDD